MVSIIKLNKYVGPDSGLRNKYGMLPMEACFIDDMENILKHVNEKKLYDPNLSIGTHNIKRLI